MASMSNVLIFSGARDLTPVSVLTPLLSPSVFFYGLISFFLEISHVASMSNVLII